MSRPVVELAKRLHHPAAEAALERHALFSALSGRRIAQAALDIEKVPQ